MSMKSIFAIGFGSGASVNFALMRANQLPIDEYGKLLIGSVLGTIAIWLIVWAILFVLDKLIDMISYINNHFFN